MDLGLEGKKALVTGATRGIGRAIAETFLAEGASVAICSRNAHDVGVAVSEMGASGLVVGSALDVADHDALERWVAAAAESLGGIDIYVHTTSAKAGSEPGDWAAGVDIDLLALVRGVRAAEPHLKRGGGVVIAIGTVAAVEHFLVGSNSYSALKSAAMNWILGQAQVLGAEGVRCNVVSPGPILVPDGSWDRVRTEAPLLFAGAEQRHPAGRLGCAQDIANAVAFMASDAARHVNGVNLTVDGGFLKRVDF